MLIGLATACSGKTHTGNSQANAGSGGASAGSAGEGADAGMAGTTDDGVAGEGGALTATGGKGGAGGAAGQAGAASSGGVGTGGSTGGSAGTVANGGSGGSGYPPIDIGEQKKSDKLDVLFVVDNSITMADKQNVLRQSVSSFVTRLVNPLCVDVDGKPVATQPATADAACSSGHREFTPVKDMHLGVITTSIGSHGGDVCATPQSADEHLDDHAELLPMQRTNLPSYNGSGYLAYDATGAAGSTDVNHVIADLQTVVDLAGEHGCGYEAPLEAMYRFLVDPEPPTTVTRVGSYSTPGEVNQNLLNQRKSFLRPDSAVAVVILSDENDCSIRDESVGWFVGSTGRMPRSTTACAINPNDPCCRSCATNPASTPPAGCGAISDDANCKNIPANSSYATWDVPGDSLNLRCFDQQRRFGFDLLYPVERYSDALSNPQVRNRSQALVPNPLLVGDEKGPRSATLISVSVIVGAPWQDLATPASLTSGHAIEYMDGAALESNSRWPLLIGNKAQNQPPSDPFMIEAIEERAGQNPLTNAPIVPSTSTNPLATINGHEQNLPQRDDLQFACSFPLVSPKVCANGDPVCACSPDKAGNWDAVKTNRSPLCQPPEGGAATTTQYFGRGYPGTRELTFAKQLGARAVPASICPRTLTDTNSPDYAFKPAFNALITRIGATLK